jgi:hypothetical protein
VRCPEPFIIVGEGFTVGISTEAWLDTITDEYLKGFIRDGGAALKFAVPGEGVEPHRLVEMLRERAVAENHQFAFVDAAWTKMQMIDRIFFEVARQVNWDELSRSFVVKFFLENDYLLPEFQEGLNLQQIAHFNRREEKFLRKEIQSWLEERIYNDFEMSQEFRLAMIRLCLDQLDPDSPASYLGSAVKEWLRGELRLISTLKEALIVQKIARHNARHLFYSLAHWLRLNGRSGLVLALDISRCLVPKRSKEPDEGLFYSIPAVLDVYELLRQFIDGADEVEGCLVVAVAPRAFLVDEKRGVGRYEALKLRIWDDVHDRKRENPLSSLIRLADTETSMQGVRG